MYITKIITQNRRDFRAYVQCEHCRSTDEIDGYDDTYFHNKVLPERKCKNCEKSSKDGENPPSPRNPKYNDNIEV